MSMQSFSVMSRDMYLASQQLTRPKRIQFKSEKVQLSPKAKELLTKYRKGLIWKDKD